MRKELLVSIATSEPGIELTVRAAKDSSDQIVLAYDSMKVQLSASELKAALDELYWFEKINSAKINRTSDTGDMVVDIAPIACEMGFEFGK